jgi:hypothetical protein
MEGFAHRPKETRAKGDIPGVRVVYLSPATPNKGHHALIIATGKVKVFPFIKMHQGVYPFLIELRKSVPKALLSFEPATLEVIKLKAEPDPITLEIAPVVAPPLSKPFNPGGGKLEPSALVVDSGRLPPGAPAPPRPRYAPDVPHRDAVAVDFDDWEPPPRDHQADLDARLFEQEHEDAEELPDFEAVQPWWFQDPPADVRPPAEQPLNAAQDAALAAAPSDPHADYNAAQDAALAAALSDPHADYNAAQDQLAQEAMQEAQARLEAQFEYNDESSDAESHATTEPPVDADLLEESSAAE